MKLIFVLLLISFSTLAQRQTLSANLFPNGIVADACGFHEKTPEEFEKKFGKPKDKKIQRVSNPHNETKNIQTTYIWPVVEAVFLTLPDIDPSLSKTFIVKAQSTKKTSSKQKVNIGDTRKQIEQAYGKLNQKFNPDKAKSIIYWVEHEIGADTLTYSLQKDKVYKIECEKYLD